MASRLVLLPRRRPGRRAVGLHPGPPGLTGRAAIVAAAIRRKATYHRLGPGQRRHADTAAAYLLAKKPYLDYPPPSPRAGPSPPA